MFKPDQPIETKKQDNLGRASFAENIARAILEYKNKESLTFGLYGVWGSGKTSIINMVVESILDSGNQTTPIICRFNPWNYSDQNQLISQFFKQLSLTLGKKDESEGFKKASELLDLYACLIEPLKYVPSSMATIIAQKKFCSWLSGGLKKIAQKYENNLEQIKYKLNELLEKQDRKVVVVIDDIDRLNNTEIRQIFQLVKSLGDFKNTIYFLTFDRNVVVKALSDVQKGDGYEYLAKIVQVPFAIPSVAISKVQKILFGSLDSTIKDFHESKFDKQYWTNIFLGGVRLFFKSLRDVNRFINIFNLKYYLLKEDVNVIDLIAITAIEVFLPELYSEIVNKKNIFIEGYIDSGYRQNEKQHLKDILDETIGKNSRNYPVEKIKELLTGLFPKLNSIYGNLFYEGSRDAEWRRNGRICSEDNFDIFFQLSISNIAFSKSQIESIISISGNYEELYTNIESLNKNERISEFLERLLDYAGDLPEDKIQNFVTVLLDQGDKYGKDEKKMLGFDNITRISRVCYFFIKDIKDKNICYRIFKNAILSAKNSINTLVETIIWLWREHGKWTKQEPKPEEQQRVTEEQLEKLQKLVLDKINSWAADGRLIKHRDLLRILYFWRDVAGDKVVMKFMQKAIEEDEGLINFITKCPSETRSQGMGDYGFKTSFEVNLKSIENFVVLDKLIERLRTVRSNETFKKLTDKQKTAVNLVLDTYDGKVKPKF